jgi:hypothetical protein
VCIHSFLPETALIVQPIHRQPADAPGKEMEVILLLIFQAALPKIRDLLAEESV